MKMAGEKRGISKTDIAVTTLLALFPPTGVNITVAVPAGSETVPLAIKEGALVHTVA